LLQLAASVNPGTLELPPLLCETEVGVQEDQHRW
jgi:hypothetical protein